MRAHIDVEDYMSDVYISNNYDTFYIKIIFYFYRDSFKLSLKRSTYIPPSISMDCVTTYKDSFPFIVPSVRPIRRVPDYRCKECKKARVENQRDNMMKVIKSKLCCDADGGKLPKNQ